MPIIIRPRKLPLVPLSAEENLSWRGHKENFGQFAKAWITVSLSLVDCLRRELYREEYGAGKAGWDKFWRTSPWFKSLSRQNKSDKKKHVEQLADLSTRVDADDLAGLTSYGSRVLRQIVKNPLWRVELVQFMLADGIKAEQINEATIDRYYPRFIQMKETEDAEREQVGSLFDAPDESELGEQDDEVQPQDEQALVTLAEHTQKKPDRVVRVLEYLRLAAKNAPKIDDDELGDPEVRQAVWEGITRAEQAVQGIKSRLRRFE